MNGKLANRCKANCSEPGAVKARIGGFVMMAAREHGMEREKWIRLKVRPDQVGWNRGIQLSSLRLNTGVEAGAFLLSV
ncbi:hypothetical protein [Paenibacillus caui]|uniref:hypothetical protein n=1 Tax=Paenibacillus caui TaxID=2873927 RepID=UPI001CA8F621|nr:hypothetical protein [Paenibacillus caui]